jgi:hypothetical protein
MSRFDGSLNLTDFIGAMQTMVPEYRLFLIDACRVRTESHGKLLLPGMRICLAVKSNR